MVRSVLAVLTPSVVWGVLWVATGSALSRAMPDRFGTSGAVSDPMVLTCLLLTSSALSVMAGWLCATIARKAVMKHVTVLAVLQLGIGIMVQSGVGELMPLWYHATFLGLVVPMHLVGGRLRLSREPGSPES